MNAQVEVGSWGMPPIIPFVCRAARLDETEALKTFNMGLGMVLVVAPDKVDDVLAILEEQGEEAGIVGRIVSGNGEVEYVNKDQLFAFDTQDKQDAE